MGRTRQHVPPQQVPPGRDPRQMPGQGRPNPGFDRGPQQNPRGNQDRQQEIRGEMGAVQQRLTARQQWEQQYTTQRNEQIDATIPRWRQLSETEQAAYLATDPATRNAAGTNGYVHNLNNQYWKYDVHPNDPADPTTRGDLMGPNASTFYSRAFVTQRPGENGQPAPQRNNRPINDVTVLNRNGTVSTLQSNDNGMAELPTSGFGYQTHNRNDVTINGVPQPDQWGTPAAIARDINIAADYRTLFPNSSFSYGDLSNETGGSPLLYDNNRNARHGSHYNGTQADLQYIDGTGSTNSASTTPDNLMRQRSMVHIAENWGMNNFYASPDLRGELFFSPNSTVGYNNEHANHLHMGAGRGTQ